MGIKSEAMTDKEIICMWREPNYRATLVSSGQCARSNGGWWDRGSKGHWHAILDTCEDSELLGYLWEVEERLTDEQRLDYREALLTPHRGAPKMLYWVLLHATAKQKIKAIAAVLRPIVEEIHGR